MAQVQGLARPAAARLRRGAKRALTMALAVLFLPLPSLALASGAPQPLLVSGIELSLGAVDLALSSNYLVVGDNPWVNTTVHNLGDAIAPDNRLELYLGDPASTSPVGAANFSIGANATVAVAVQIATSGYVGLRLLTARVASNSPAESGPLYNNEASLWIRVHTPVDPRLEGTQVGVINTSYLHKGFVTVRGSASLTIGAGGNLSIEQLWDDEFDVLVEENALLRIAGGSIYSNRALTLVLSDNATLIVEPGSKVLVSIRSSSLGTLSLSGATVQAASLSAAGSTVLFTRSTVNLGDASFDGASLGVDNSTLRGSSSLRLTGGAAATFLHSRVEVASTFGSIGAAEGRYPGISAYANQARAPYQPAVDLGASSTASFTLTSVSSVIDFASGRLESSKPIVAAGGATATVYRIARFEVQDPTGAPVLNASVEVFDYLANSTLIASATAANGTVDIALRSDLLQDGFDFHVGNYIVIASRAGVQSPGVALAFPAFPELGADSLVRRVPMALGLFAPWGLYAQDVPPLVYGAATTLQGDQAWNSSVHILAPLTLDTATVTLAQSHDFQRYVVVDGAGALDAISSTLRSDYAFNLYVINGTSTQLEQTTIAGGNLLLGGALLVSITNSRVLGSAIGSAVSITVDGSYVWGEVVDLTADTLAMDDSVMAARAVVSISAVNTDLSKVALTGQFSSFDYVNETALPYDSFAVLAESDVAGLLSSPEARLNAGTVTSRDIVVWTGGNLLVLVGAGNSVFASARLLAGSAGFWLASSVLTVESSTIAPEATLSFAGDGSALLRGVGAPAPSVSGSVAVSVFDAVEVTVFDQVRIPVEGALATAVPQVTGPARETGTTDFNGVAFLFLLRETVASGGATLGSSYRVGASFGAATSGTAVWDPSAPGPVTLTLPATFSVLTGAILFAVVVPLGGANHRLLSTNIVDLTTASELAAVQSFLLSFNLGPLTLDVAAPAYPGAAARVFVGADYRYSHGPFSTTRPMAGASGSASFDGGAPITFTLDDEGFGGSDLTLPGARGAHVLSVSVSGALLPGAVTELGNLSLDTLPKLSLTTALLNRAGSIRPADQLRLTGIVTFSDGQPVVNATVVVDRGVGTPVSGRTDETGAYFVVVPALADAGAHALQVRATAPNAQDSDSIDIQYTVASGATTGPGTSASNFNLFTVVFGAVLSVVFLLGALLAWTQRRAARGEFVECGNCGKFTYASAGKCVHCDVEFDDTNAKCSNCGTWVRVAASTCPNCGTVFNRKGAPEKVTPGALPTAQYSAPNPGELPVHTAPLRLEEMEFRLPGTTETMELGDTGTSPAFAAVTRPLVPVPQPRVPPLEIPRDRPLERLGLPPEPELDNPIKEVSAGLGGQMPRKEPVSFGTANMDLSRPVPAATSTKADEKDAVEPMVSDDVLRELLRQAAPELSGEVLPGDIRRELAEIARAEAPVAAEKKASGSRSERAAPSSERPMEAPEKSRKSAFDVFQTPTKNIPAGYERKGAEKPKEGAKGPSPVCPNCGGNWVIFRDGKNSCRVCGTRW